MQGIHLVRVRQGVYYHKWVWAVVGCNEVQLLRYIT